MPCSARQAGRTFVPCPSRCTSSPTRTGIASGTIRPRGSACAWCGSWTTCSTSSRADPDFRSFLLDGQAIVLDDYLAARPEQEERLRRLFGEGRLEAGPWYVLADEFLVSAEALVRNLLAGQRTVRRLGGDADGHRILPRRVRPPGGAADAVPRLRPRGGGPVARVRGRERRGRATSTAGARRTARRC